MIATVVRIRLITKSFNFFRNYSIVGDAKKSAPTKTKKDRR